MLRLSEEKDEISVVNDQIGSPTYARDLAIFILNLMNFRNKDYGVYHYSNQGELSWHDFAKAIFELSDINIKLNPISSNEYITEAERPLYSVLNTNKIKHKLNIDIPDWKSSLKKAILNLNEK